MHGPKWVQSPTTLRQVLAEVSLQLLPRQNADELVVQVDHGEVAEAEGPVEAVDSGEGPVFADLRE